MKRPGHGLRTAPHLYFALAQVELTLQGVKVKIARTDVDAKTFVNELVAALTAFNVNALTAFTLILKKLVVHCLVCASKQHAVQVPACSLPCSFPCVFQSTFSSCFSAADGVNRL